ncbi:MAG: hypothetical protein IPO53_02485 [Chitinophagaceae bacterium]|nr:hypothetical protein [Chitinophagaceae bacterium]
MQPKFTQLRLGSFCTKIIAIALIFSASTQISFAQKNQAKQPNQVNENILSLFEKQKLDRSIKALPQAKNAKASNKQTDNDAGLPNRAISYLANNPQGICTTFTGTLAAGDATLPGPRMFRDGVPSTCAAPKPCPATSGAAGNWYDTYTFINPSAAAQCVTIDFTNTSANTFAHFVSAYLGSFTPANLCTNYLADQGGSAAAGGNAVFSFTLPGSATMVLCVMGVTVGTGGTYTMTVDAPVGCGAAPPCSWSASTVSPVSILDQACVTVGSFLYSFAGVGTGAVIATSNKFDGTVWTPIAPTPQALEYPGGCTDGTNIYLLGGASSVGTPLTTLYRYNVAANTYTTLAPFTVGVWNTAAVYLGGKIYKIGGTGPGTASTNAVEIYDIASNTWTAGAPYPIAASFISAIQMGGFIYTAGGNASGTEQTKTYRYDPVANSWNDAAIADLSATRWGAASGFYNNSFLLAGGYSAAAISNTVVAWDLATNTWSALPNMTTATGRVGGAVLGPAMYVIGGRTVASAGFGGSTQNQRLFCIPPTPCAGAPAPGNTLASPNPVCSGTGFTLSLQNNPFVSGFTYQWQKSATGVAGSYTDIVGATSITYSGTQTGATWYRCNVTCTPSALTTASTPVLLADGQGVFTSQPASTSTQCSANATFSFTATGASLVYGWEYRITPASPWLTVTNGALYSGATTTTLTITGAASTMNGYQYRGLISGPCTAVDFSNVATLTVTPLVASVNISSATICTGTIQQLTLTNATSATTTTFASATPLNIQIPDLTGPPASSAPVVEAGINHTIPVALPPGAQVFQIDVKVNISHTYASDLKLVLKNSTTNQVINLFYHKSGAQTAGANFTNTIISSAGTLRFSAVAPPFTNTFRADLELNPGSYGDAGGAGPTAFQPTTNSWSTLWVVLTRELETGP